MNTYVTIYHNPSCATSRNTLALIRNTGIEPTIIEYLKTPITRQELEDLIRVAGLTVREAIREKGTPFTEVGLNDLSLTDEELTPWNLSRSFSVVPLSSLRRGCVSVAHRNWS